MKYFRLYKMFKLDVIFNKKFHQNSIKHNHKTLIWPNLVRNYCAKIQIVFAQA